MAKITLSLDGNLIKEIKLNREIFTIGRRPNNDIQIDNLAVSGEHAIITMRGSEAFIEDLNSTNGTKVNNQDVHKQHLKEGDEVLIGKHILHYFSEKPTENTDFEKTMMLGRPPIASTPKPAAAPPKSTIEPQAEAPNFTPRLGVIKVLSGGNTGKELELSKNLTTLGKTGVQVAVITKRPQGYFLTHVEGEHHPSVNQKEIGIQAHPLQEEDTIELLGIKMMFFYRS
ncbi:FHA domain-containing protein [Iodobacter sp. CM08]|uniref:FHA domain-containing protein n=1 Tax=Iodobacter sp. CM08 TaxID=3085902 RepID=UPI0029825AAB|nr:FHA domain-containing protein [Iodobacter sp. CM08]MDW5415288.1 FHA domain-containing protein [Iodobacter sp. CM08]